MDSLPIIIHEHEAIPEKFRENIKDITFVGNPDYMGVPQYMGIDSDYRASYYIGADWLVENEQAIAVLPKMADTDFMGMFVAALDVNCQHEADYFSKCYGIQLGKPAIELPKELNQLTPLLILHYISLLTKLTKRELKKDYVTRQKNLKSKIKGKILFSQHLQQNIFSHREERIFCQYQDYTADIPENRLLKKALIFAEQIISRYASFKKRYNDLKPQLNMLSTAFQEVSADIELYEVRKIRTNKMFKEYNEAIRVAKMILRRFDYSLDNVNEENRLSPPFWIDMARLYEMWVWDKLTEVYGSDIDFQVKGHCRTQVDYIKKGIDKWIMDAKYKPRYANPNAGILDDIREISGYARDTKILKQLGLKTTQVDYNEEIKCLIIYPEPQKFIIAGHLEDEDISEIQTDACVEFVEKIDVSQASEIPLFRNFYKISVPLPRKK